MKNTLVNFGIVVAIVCCGIFALSGCDNSIEYEQDIRDAVEVNLSDALETYLVETEQCDSVNDITIYNRYYDDNYDGQVAECMVFTEDGAQFCKFRVESLADWFVANH